jgi:putative oxidoreductase
MRRIFNTNLNQNVLNFALLFLRISIGSLILIHGLPKLHMLFAGGPIKFADPLGVGMIPSLIFTVFAEVFCSILVILGFGTRLAVLPLMVTTLVAIFIIHVPEGIQNEALPAHYVLVYLFCLLLSGSGKFSVDAFVSKRLNRRRRRR